MQAKEKNGASSIAWFKLAQFVTTKEKEKALGLYKLLSYSIDNKAYSLQVEADLFLAFEDYEVAMTKYQQAALLYKKEKNLVLAASVYEHLTTLQPENPHFLSTLIEVYARLEWEEKVEERFNKLIENYKNNKINKDVLLNTIDQIRNVFADENKESSLKKFVAFVNIKAPEFAT
ncbi:TPA: hypothetical protein DEO28_02075 [Candidatus Dependentiae bacterium]|nr:MAG: hypothetical protein UR14_C0004G0097 [candidate division TM6 bacterium GW2011_GWE2_31_21]KKP53017.1 MAG: hypothetical protein UR43_C0008G0099 [candidate division TM6 bacterium GW2011_GWF2_33_332]HBS47746.1 hypothetical protein [Candidatus Dependentiae bacterium]HBZ73278.1 hypothetical protein [Candidatus Dependentiae bacterium]